MWPSPGSLLLLTHSHLGTQARLRTACSHARVAHISESWWLSRVYIAQSVRSQAPAFPYHPTRPHSPPHRRSVCAARGADHPGGQLRQGGHVAAGHRLAGRRHHGHPALHGWWVSRQRSACTVVCVSACFRGAGWGMHGRLRLLLCGMQLAGAGEVSSVLRTCTACGVFFWKCNPWHVRPAPCCGLGLCTAELGLPLFDTLWLRACAGGTSAPSTRPADGGGACPQSPAP